MNNRTNDATGSTPATAAFGANNDPNPNGPPLVPPLVVVAAADAKTPVPLNSRRVNANAVHANGPAAAPPVLPPVNHDNKFAPNPATDASVAGCGDTDMTGAGCGDTDMTGTAATPEPDIDLAPMSTPAGFGTAGSVGAVPAAPTAPEGGTPTAAAICATRASTATSTNADDPPSPRLPRSAGAPPVAGPSSTPAEPPPREPPAPGTGPCSRASGVTAARSSGALRESGSSTASGTATADCRSCGACAWAGAELAGRGPPRVATCVKGDSDVLASEDPDDPPEPRVSANATGTDTSAAPTHRVTAIAPTRPT